MCVCLDSIESIESIESIKTDDQTPRLREDGGSMTFDVERGPNDRRTDCFVFFRNSIFFPLPIYLNMRCCYTDDDHDDHDDDDQLFDSTRKTKRNEKREKKHVEEVEKDSGRSMGRLVGWLDG